MLLRGVLGNISDADVRATVSAIPQLCKSGGTVIWTRTRRPVDLTPRVRLAEVGFKELAFIAPENELFSVGACRFLGEPQPTQLGSTTVHVRQLKG